MDDSINEYPLLYDEELLIALNDIEHIKKGTFPKDRNHVFYKELTKLSYKIRWDDSSISNRKQNKYPKNKNEPYLYLMHIKEINTLKIGISIDPKKRRSELQVGSPFKIKILFAIKCGHKLEEKLHNKFSYINLNGEWFQYSEDIVNEFKLLDKKP